jgi:hypothetical protein
MVYTSEACTFHTPIPPGAQLGGDAKLPYDFRFDANSQQWWALLKAAEWRPETVVAKAAWAYYEEHLKAWEKQKAAWAYYEEQMKAWAKGGESVLVTISAPTRIDTTRLVVQCVLVALLTGGVVFTLRTRPGQSRET